MTSTGVIERDTRSLDYGSPRWFGVRVQGFGICVSHGRDYKPFGSVLGPLKLADYHVGSRAWVSRIRDFGLGIAVSICDWTYSLVIRKVAAHA